MEFSFGTLIGQIIGLLLFVLIIYFVVLVPIALMRIANALSGINEEFRRRSGPSG